MKSIEEKVLIEYLGKEKYEDIKKEKEDTAYWHWLVNKMIEKEEKVRQETIKECREKALEIIEKEPHWKKECKEAIKQIITEELR